ncbi:hypothetical protein HDV00_004125 [Rhizophlyctis rosea]|nr:hypothetical protein HDV00_004125 [Rhizophlyctis rosea]
MEELRRMKEELRAKRAEKDDKGLEERLRKDGLGVRWEEGREGEEGFWACVADQLSSEIILTAGSLRSAVDDYMKTHASTAPDNPTSRTSDFLTRLLKQALADMLKREVVVWRGDAHPTTTPISSHITRQQHQHKRSNDPIRLAVSSRGVWGSVVEKSHSDDKPESEFTMPVSEDRSSSGSGKMIYTTGRYMTGNSSGRWREFRMAKDEEVDSDTKPTPQNQKVSFAARNSYDHAMRSDEDADIRKTLRNSLHDREPPASTRSEQRISENWATLDPNTYPIDYEKATEHLQSQTMNVVRGLQGRGGVEVRIEPVIRWRSEEVFDDRKGPESDRRGYGSGGESERSGRGSTRKWDRDNGERKLYRDGGRRSPSRPGSRISVQDEGEDSSRGLGESGRSTRRAQRSSRDGGEDSGRGFGKKGRSTRRVEVAPRDEEEEDRKVREAYQRLRAKVNGIDSSSGGEGRTNWKERAHRRESATSDNETKSRWRTGGNRDTTSRSRTPSRTHTPSRSRSSSPEPSHKHHVNLNDSYDEEEAIKIALDVSRKTLDRSGYSSPPLGWEDDEDIRLAITRLSAEDGGEGSSSVWGWRREEGNSGGSRKGKERV